jgi:hypothetical protein
MTASRQGDRSRPQEGQPESGTGAGICIDHFVELAAKENLPTRVSSSVGLPEARRGEQDRPSSRLCCDGHHWEGHQCHVRRPS